MTWDSLFLTILNTSEAPWKENLHTARNNRHLESEMECKDVTQRKTSEWLKTFDVLNQKHINSSPANAKAWRITRLLKQPYSSLYTCNPHFIPDASILKDPSSRWHWSFTLTSPPAPNPADSPYIWNALRSWYTIRYIVGKKKCFWRLFWIHLLRFFAANELRSRTVSMSCWVSLKSKCVQCILGLIRLVCVEKVRLRTHTHIAIGGLTAKA